MAKWPCLKLITQFPGQISWMIMFRYLLASWINLFQSKSSFVGNIDGYMSLLIIPLHRYVSLLISPTPRHCPSLVSSSVGCVSRLLLMVRHSAVTVHEMKDFLPFMDMKSSRMMILSRKIISLLLPFKPPLISFRKCVYPHHYLRIRGKVQPLFL